MTTRSKKIDWGMWIGLTFCSLAGCWAVYEVALLNRVLMIGATGVQNESK